VSVFNIVVFYGHGELMLSEDPAKTPVPTGCKLLLFARHKEQISRVRMLEIVDDLLRYGWDPGYYKVQDRSVGPENYADNEGRRRWGPGFISRMKEAGHLRRIRTAGDLVHNYRLFPQDDRSGYIESVEGLYEAATTKYPGGVALKTLMKDHGKPGTMMLWVPCRAVEGLPGKNTLLDVYGQSRGSVALRNKQGEEVQAYIRPGDWTYAKRKNS
jgi:hypothetical protein